MAVDKQAVRTATIALLYALGYDWKTDALRGTPDRVARAWSEFLDYDAGCVDTKFESVTTDQMVIVKGMRVWSVCEHHLLPFWCDVSIAYIARTHVLGLSKFARIAHKHAHRLQLQERLVHQIADEVARVTKTRDVAVIAKGEHLCMTSRGIRTPAEMISSRVLGVFRKAAVRAEFLSLVS